MDAQSRPAAAECAERDSRARRGGEQRGTARRAVPDFQQCRQGCERGVVPEVPSQCGEQRGKQAEQRRHAQHTLHAAIHRAETGKTTLYDMTDVMQ